MLQLLSALTAAIPESVFSSRNQKGKIIVFGIGYARRKIPQKIFSKPLIMKQYGITRDDCMQTSRITSGFSAFVHKVRD